MMRFAPSIENSDGGLVADEYDDSIIEADFPYGNKPKKKKLTKEEIIYGIFADTFGSSDDDAGIVGGSASGRRRRDHAGMTVMTGSGLSTIGGGTSSGPFLSGDMGSIGGNGGIGLGLGSCKAVRFVSGGINAGTIGEDKGIIVHSKNKRKTYLMGSKNQQIFNNFLLHNPSAAISDDDDDNDEDSDSEVRNAASVNSAAAGETEDWKSEKITKDIYNSGIERNGIDNNNEDINSSSDTTNDDVILKEPRQRQNHLKIHNRCTSALSHSESSSSDDLRDSPERKNTDKQSQKGPTKNIQRSRKFKFDNEEIHDRLTTASMGRVSDPGGVNNCFKGSVEKKLQMGTLSKAYGVGFKLLQKMGYEGGALGKDGSGLVGPLQVKIRARNRGLQDQGERIKENDLASGRMDSRIGGTADEEALQLLLGGDVSKHRVSSNWKIKKIGVDKNKKKSRSNSRDSSNRRNRKGKEISAEGRLLAELHGTNGGSTGNISSCIGGRIGLDDEQKVMKIIDMTQPSVKILNSTEELAQRMAAYGKEINHNVNSTFLTDVPLRAWRDDMDLLMDNLENELKRVALDKKLNEDMLIELSHDGDNLLLQNDHIHKQLSKAQQLLYILTSLRNRMSGKNCSHTAEPETKEKKQLQEIHERYQSKQDLNYVSNEEKDKEHAFYMESDEGHFVRTLGYEAPEISNKGVSNTENSNNYGLVIDQVKPSDVVLVNGEELEGIFWELQEEFFPDLGFFNSSIIYFSFVKYHLELYFSNWKPLVCPSYGIPEVERWRDFFCYLWSSNDLKNETTTASNGTTYYAGVSTAEYNNNTNDGDCNTNSRGNTRKGLIGNANNPLTQTYYIIVQEVVLSKIRDTLLHEWNVYDVESGINVCEAWHKVLPSYFLDTLFQEALVPRLSSTIDNFHLISPSASSSCNTLHSIILPWVGLLGPSCFQSLLSTVKYKITMHLQQFSPSDISYLDLLSPWNSAFDIQTWNNLLQRFVVPKFHDALYSLQVTPHCQSVDLIINLLKWKPLVGLECVVKLLQTCLLPKWLQTLEVWLASPNVDYGEILLWYEGWKNLLGADITSHANIVPFFLKGLHLMNNATAGFADMGVSMMSSTSNNCNVYGNAGYARNDNHGSNICIGVNVYDTGTAGTFGSSAPESLPGVPSTQYFPPPPPPPPPPIPPMIDGSFTDFQHVSAHQSNPSFPATNSVAYDNFAAFMDNSTTNFHESAAPPPAEPPPPTPEEDVVLNLREYLEEIAAQKDIIMKPKFGRLQNSNQVYAFGKLSIYISKNIIYAYVHNKWSPIDIDDLVQMQ